jgi:hypothetical protein
LEEVFAQRDADGCSVLHYAAVSKADGAAGVVSALVARGAGSMATSLNARSIAPADLAFTFENAEVGTMLMTLGA